MMGSMFKRKEIGGSGEQAEPAAEKLRRLGSRAGLLGPNEIQELEYGLEEVIQKLADGVSVQRESLSSLLESIDSIYRRFGGSLIDRHDLSALFFQARTEVERSLLKSECGFGVDDFIQHSGTLWRSVK
jgi:hypothetical protein